MDALVEAHDPDELARAVVLGADPIGVNARDLTTFAIDRRAQLELVAKAPNDRTVVAESGVTARVHAIEAELAGAKAVLVGSTLMRSTDPGATLAALISRPVVKVCGLTRQQDVDAAVAAGADLCGFVLEPESPRAAADILDVGDAALSVAVVVGRDNGYEADLVQLYEREAGTVRGRDAVLLRNGSPVARVVDLPWDGEDPLHIDRARGVRGRLMLAGGLSPENVADAIAAVQPWAVDASSSLESAPGIKDHARVRAFVEAARG
jgi:phosphoribosylanthranilate isomerase